MRHDVRHIIYIYNIKESPIRIARRGLVHARPDYVCTYASCASRQARGKFDRTKWRSSKHCWGDVVLSSTHPIHGSASKVNCSGADAQVTSCHRYLVVFHPFVEQLTVFHISELVLTSSSILKTLTPIVMASWAARAKEVCKLCINPYISIVNHYRQTYIYTYIQAQPQTKTPLTPATPAQLWPSR